MDYCTIDDSRYINCTIVFRQLTPYVSLKSCGLSWSVRIWQTEASQQKGEEAFANVHLRNLTCYRASKQDKVHFDPGSGLDSLMNNRTVFMGLSISIPITVPIQGDKLYLLVRGLHHKVWVWVRVFGLLTICRL